MNRWLVHATTLLALLLLLVPVAAQLKPAGTSAPGEWRHYAGDIHGTKYSPLTQITKDNLPRLTVAWRWKSRDGAIQAVQPNLRPGRFEDTPLMANGVLYTVTSLGIVAALDPGTGRPKWMYDPESYKAGRPTNAGFVNRGVAYWTNGTSARILHSTGDAYLLSLDARTGHPDLTFGASGRVDLAAGLKGAVRPANFSGRSPFIAGDVIVVGSSISDQVLSKESPPGYLRVFDVRSGKLLWEFHTVPQKGEVGYDTWLEGSAEYSGNTNVWAAMAYDADLDYVYFPTSTPTNDYYGGQRPGNNLFAESLVCVEARTGRRVWHFQAIHHGLWDYDLPAGPVLGDITVNGRPIKAVMQVSKQAFTYVFDRRTGEPVWPASLFFYAAAIPLAFVNPWLSDALYILVALVWLVPDRRIEAVL